MTNTIFTVAVCISIVCAIVYLITGAAVLWSWLAYPTPNNKFVAVLYPGMVGAGVMFMVSAVSTGLFALIARMSN